MVVPGNTGVVNHRTETDIKAYNDYVNDRINDDSNVGDEKSTVSALAATDGWKIVGSTASVVAVDNLNAATTGGPPIYWFNNDDKVANNSAEFWDGNFATGDDGVVPTEGQVWTGTNGDGTGTKASGAELGSGGPIAYGNLTQAGTTALGHGAGLAAGVSNSADAYQFYALSPALPLDFDLPKGPAPTPSTWRKTLTAARRWTSAR